MLNPIISVLVGVAVVALTGLATKGSWAYGVVPGLILSGVTFFVIGRRVRADLEARMQKVQTMLQPKRQGQMPRFGAAIEILEGALKWEKWQPLVGSQVRGQIGTIYYYDKKFDKAEPYLAASFGQNWMAKAMYAAIRYRKKDKEGVVSSLESALKWTKKESLLWNMYAWFLWKFDDVDGAIGVLNRAMSHVASDERTQRNLKNLQNGKAMKLKGWDMMWYQFHLEKPSQSDLMKQQRRYGNKANFRGR